MTDVAWENFIASVDPVAVELERVTSSAVSAEVAAHALLQERFGSRRHHEALWVHELRRAASKRALAAVPVPVWWSARQLEIARAAQDAANGPVSVSEGRVGSAAHENTSTKVNPATGHVASNEETNERKAA